MSLGLFTRYGLSQVVAGGGGGGGPDETEYYVTITVQAAEVDATVTDFPVYVNLANLPAGFWTAVQSDGGDLRVTENDGTTRAPVELVRINTGASTGELHFLASSLSSSTDTVYRIYYGKTGGGLSQPAVTDTYGRNAVWTDYQHVWHLSEAASTDDALDSTGTLNLDANGNPAVQSAKVGAGRRLLATGDSTTPTEWFDTATTTGPSTPSAATVQLWLASSYTGATGNQYFQYGNRWALQRVDTSLIGLTFDGSFAAPIAKSAAGMLDGSLHLHHGTFDGTTTRMYSDGAVSTTTAAQTIGAIGGLGRQIASIGVNSLDGSPAQNDTADEVRVRFSALSADWVAAEYSNQNTPTTFYAVGSQQAA